MRTKKKPEPAPSRRAIHPAMRLYLNRDVRCFGPGTYTLLTLIDETHSLSTACSRMNLSYSKGWRMVTNIEQQLGFSAVERQRGGKEGGQSRLTQEGRALLQTYSAFQDECEGFMQQAYERHFGTMFGEPDAP